ncbi:hypothetical protein [Streptomyces sp. NBC_01190]|uniref:baeRF10 domain-containing protein n=1 Tax=Streptomyces sp. NBC_01190 TaxID=2903767 RepID=UPI003865ED4C|nr:hypothetical protein OG519_04255 [Streptomyces sp. NBC_01190]
MITQETVDRIRHFEDSRFPVVSVYARVEVDPSRRNGFRTRLNGLLNEVRAKADDTSVDHDIRMSLRADMVRIEEAAGRERPDPGTVAFFSCAGRDFFEEVALPRPVRDGIFLDATPWIRPLVATLDEYHRTCAVLIDKSRVRVWEFHLDEMREIEKSRDPRLRKPHHRTAATLVESHVRNKADELSKRHYRRVAAMLDDLFRDGGFELLVVGGPAFEVPAFAACLSREVRSRIAGTFTVDMDSATPAEVREQVSAIVGRFDRAEERRLVDEAMEAAATGRPVALGLPAGLWAGSVAAARTLLVQEGEVAPGVVCDQDGWLALTGETCPFCGQAVRKTPDVIDELVAAVIAEGGSVNHVAADTRLNGQVTAAMLRFPLPAGPGMEQ